MKKQLVFVLVAVLLVLSLAGCGKSNENNADAAQTNVSTNEGTTSGSTDTTNETTAETANAETAPASTPEPVIIAVAWNSIDASSQAEMKYLQEYVGPALGIEFIFSEGISDIDTLMTFLENSYAAGAQGLFSTITDGLEQLVARADELGIYTAVKASRFVDQIAEVPTYMGITGVDISKVAAAYGELLQKQFNASEPAHFLIISGGSAMGVASHREAAISMLSTIKDMYGLTYDADVTELAISNATTDINTNSENVTITIVPGFPNMEGYVAGVSGLLQTGEYDAVISVYPTTEVFATAIDEVEKAVGKNIKVLAQVNFGESTKTAFETLDSTGNPTLDGGILYSGTAQDAFGVVLLYNGITGAADIVKDNGKAITLAPGAMVCSSAAEYALLAQIDTTDDMYVYTTDELKQVIKVYNPAATHEDIMKLASDFSTDNILSRKGLK